MSFHRDPDRFTRGVGAIAARDAGDRHRQQRRAQRRSMMIARDRQLAGFTYGAFGAIQRDLDSGPTGGGSGGPTGRPIPPTVRPTGVSLPTSTTQGTVGPRPTLRPPIVSIDRPILMPGRVQPQPGRPSVRYPFVPINPNAPSSSSTSSGGGAYPGGSGSGAGVILDPAPPASHDLDLIEPTAPPASSPAAQGPNLKKLAVIGGVIAAGYLLLRKRQP